MLARVFVYLSPFISQILDFIYRMVLIFILIYFEWRDAENQHYPFERLSQQQKKKGTILKWGFYNNF